MGAYKINVTEYGIKRKNKIIPSHYTWDYCVENKIPFIIVKPKIKYSNIKYDLLTVDYGLSFPENNKLVNYWWKIYENYIEDVHFPINKVPIRIIGEVTDNFNIFKIDQERIVNKLMAELEYFVNKYSTFDPKRKAYYDETEKSNEINKKREEYLKNTRY